MSTHTISGHNSHRAAPSRRFRLGSGFGWLPRRKASQEPVIIAEPVTPPDETQAPEPWPLENTSGEASFDVFAGSSDIGLPDAVSPAETTMLDSPPPMERPYVIPAAAWVGVMAADGTRGDCAPLGSRPWFVGTIQVGQRVRAGILLGDPDPVGQYLLEFEDLDYLTALRDAADEAIGALMASSIVADNANSPDGPVAEDAPQLVPQDEEDSCETTADDAGDAPDEAPEGDEAA